MSVSGDTVVDEGLSALSWVHDELRRSLEAAHKALRRYLRAAAEATDLDPVDPAILRQARAQLHQAVGAVDLVGLGPAGQVLHASEAALQRLSMRPKLITQAAVEAIERGSFAVLDYIGRRLVNKTVTPLSLFPQYRVLQELAGASRIHPADLWPVSFSWRNLPLDGSAAPREPDAATVALVEADLLAQMRGAPPSVSSRMSEVFTGLAASLLQPLPPAPAGQEPADHVTERQLATLWQLAAAFYEAQSDGLLKSDVFSKRIGSRLLAQLRAGAGAEVSQRLAHDLLFFCSQAAPRVGVPVLGLGSGGRLRAVRQGYVLADEPVVDFELPRLGRFDPAWVSQARKRVAAAKELWSAVAGGDLTRLQGLTEQMALVSESLQRLYPDGGVLGRALVNAAQHTTSANAEPPADLAMEVATALLYLDASLDDADFDQPELSQRVHRLAQRIDQVRQKRDPGTLELWMEDLYRRVSDRQTMGNVVQELRATLSEVEKHIDQYFRNPAQRDVLIPVPGHLKAMRGVLSVLGLDQASQAVGRMGDDVDALADTEADPLRAIQSGSFDRLADNLGALSFLIDMVAVQPQMAKSLFRFDPVTGSLSAVMARQERPSGYGELEGADAAAGTPLPASPDTDAVAVTLEFDRIVKQAKAQQRHGEPLSGQGLPMMGGAPLGSSLLGELSPPPAPQAPAAQPFATPSVPGPLSPAPDSGRHSSIEAAMSGPGALPALADPASSPAPAPAPEPASTPAVLLVEADDEMREVFFEEAREVVQNARSALAQLDVVPEDRSTITTVRRAFHTLKGSSRMVGFQAFGEAAWACEQLYNARLAAEPPSTDTSLRAFSRHALGYLEQWVDALASHQAAGFGPHALVAEAQALSATPVMAPLVAPSFAEPEPETWPEPGAEHDEPVATQIMDWVDEPAPAPAGASTELQARVPGLPSALELELPRLDPQDEHELTDLPTMPVDLSELPELPQPPSADLPVLLPLPMDPLPAPAVQAPWPAPAQTLAPEGWASRSVPLVEPLPVPEVSLPDLDLDELAPMDLGDGASPTALEATRPLPVPSEWTREALARATDDLPTLPAQPDAPSPTDTNWGEIDVSLDQADVPADFGDTDVDLPLDMPPDHLPAGRVPASLGLNLSEGYKQIGPLRISQTLFNIFLNEADELSSHLGELLALWRSRPEHPVGELAVARAHSLAGSSGTVGYGSLSHLARTLEHALERAQARGRALGEEPELFCQAADEIRRLLHLFAAGFLNQPDAQLQHRLEVLAHAPLDDDEALLAASAPMPLDRPTGTTPLYELSEFGHSDMSPLGRHRPASEERGTAFDDELDQTDAIDAELFVVFEEEGVELLPRLHASLRDWSRRPTDPGQASAAMRSLHTFKGGARLAGAMRLGELAHRLETAIERLTARRQPATTPDIETLMAHADVLDQQFDLLRGVAPAAATGLDVPTGFMGTSLEATIGHGLPTAPMPLGLELPLAAAEPAGPALPPAPAIPVPTVDFIETEPWPEAPAQPGPAATPVPDTETETPPSAEAFTLPAFDLPKAVDLDAGLAPVAPVPVSEWTPPIDRWSPLLETEDSLPTAPSVFDDHVAASPPAAPVFEPVLDSPAAPLAPFDPFAAPVVEPHFEPSNEFLNEPESVSTPVSEFAPEPTPGPAPALPAQIDWTRFAHSVDLPVEPPAVARAATGSVRVRAAILDRLVGHAGEVSIARARIEADVQQFRSALTDLSDNLERLRAQLRDIELQAETQMASRLDAARAAQRQFDPLEMDRFTRFQELTRMMAESVSDVATVQRGLQRTLQSTEDTLAHQHRMSRDMQDDLLRTRLVEFESLSERLYRVVRQAAKETGKPVRLDIVGGSIEVDRGVLDRMTPAFEHLLRNSVVHGIESAEQRAAAGKDATGHITMSVGQIGNEVAVEVRDDGAGLHLERIRERALATGLITPETEPDPADLANLIFQPGFTTAQEVTEMAGRGVGMDVVRTEVNAIGGRIETASTPGQGASFRLVLPLTTAVTQVVMLRCGERSVAVPSTLVESVTRVPVDELETYYTRGVARVADRELPFFWLDALLQGTARGTGGGGRNVPIVVIRSANRRVVLHVDEVQSNQEVVVKHLGPQLSRLPGLVGMTLLPSGKPALIYNPVPLANLYGQQAQARVQAVLQGLQPAEAEPGEGAPSGPSTPLVLVVDDSLTVRRVTQRLLEREGYRVLLAKDGQDALDRLSGELPQVVLSDIEMPRMDGFDLLRSVRSTSRLAQLPVIMITSRLAQKHRDYAAELGANHYLGKPYSEDELLRLIARYAPRDAALTTA